MSISKLLTQFGDQYVQALLTTWKLTALAFTLAFLIGIVIMVMRICPIKSLRMGEIFMFRSSGTFPARRC